MNINTHILTGALVGLLVSVTTQTPDVEFLVFSGMIGGLVPELDFLLGKHRKSLHFPSLAFFATLVLLTLTLLSNSIYILYVLTFSASLWLHSFMDIFAGAELKSWDKTRWRQKAVFDHLRKKWVKPRRLAYGGSKEDMFLSLLIYILLLIFMDNFLLLSIYTLLFLLGLGYSLGIRKFTEKYEVDTSTLNEYVRNWIRKRLS